MLRGGEIGDRWSAARGESSNYEYSSLSSKSGGAGVGIVVKCDV
jgi:hypothetical protein